MVVEFSRLVYLDVQKTGSTQLEALLEEALGEEPVDRRRHAPVDAARRGKLHVISTRDPWSLYRSLYRYGVDQQGMAFRRIRDAGRAEVYADFPGWLDFVLDPANAELVEGSWARSGTASLLGLMSYRYLRLAVADPDRRLRGLRTRRSLDRALERHGIVQEVVENARLEADLLGILDRNAERLQLDRERIPALAERWTTAERRNSSAPAHADFDAASVRRVAERESWLVERFAYPIPA